MEDPKTGEERHSFVEDDPEQHRRAARQPEVEGHMRRRSEEEPEVHRRSDEGPEVEGHRFTSPEDPQRRS